MKKLLLVALVLIASVAQAEDKPAKNFGHIQYAYRSTTGDNANDPNRQGGGISLGHKFSNNSQIDLVSQFRIQNGNTTNTMGRTEVGVTLSEGHFYVRGATGLRNTSTDSDGYYSIEPGLKVKLNDTWTTKVGYRYRDSYSDSVNDQTHTVRLGAEYALNDTSSLTAMYDRSHGDADFDGVNLGYYFKF
jgi:opacity protein-like surface antigen